MADIRIKDLATTATTTASDDFMAVDGATNGTRKLSAATPAFLTSVTTPTLTSPAGIDLTLAGGSSGASLVLGQGGSSSSLTKDQNTDTALYINNPNAGAIAQATLYVSNASNTGAAGAFVGVMGTSATTEGGFVQDSGQIGSGSLLAGGLSIMSRAASSPIRFYAGSYNSESARLTSTGNLLIGTTSETGLTGAGGLKIASTTAGSYNAGALVVAGGLATGADSFFGGSRLLAQKDQNAPTRIQARNDNSGTSAQSQVSATLGDFTTYTAMGSLSAGFTTSGLFAANAGYIASNATAGLNIFTVGATSLTLGTNSTAALTLASGGAATFSGAVTANGTGTFGSSFGKVIINQWSDATNYGAITLNGNTTVAGSLGIGGGASGDSTLYFNAPTGGSIQARINGTAALTIASTSAATFAGAVTVSSTTAGSSGAGALVVTGGISAGNTGSAASYFGGDVTLSKATPALNLVNTSASTFAQYLSQSTVNRALIFGQHGDSSAGTTLGIANAAGALIATATTGVNYPDKLVITTIGRPAPIYFGTNNTLALTLDGTTQAATFAGAVTAASLATAQTAAAATSIVITHKIPITLNGTVYYMALTATP